MWTLFDEKPDRQPCFAPSKTWLGIFKRQNEKKEAGKIKMRERDAVKN